MLVSRFFRVYTQWRWPNPVLLCAIEERSLGLQVWDPRRNHKDRYHLMPIITPAYPCMNSSYNVSASTLRIMSEEFQRGSEVCEDMEANKADWETLFEPFSFFDAYKNYLQIDISAENEHDLRSWKGWVESRLRQLMLKIEKQTYNMLQCHPHPGDFSDKSKRLHHCYFMGLQRKQGVPANEGEQFDIRATVDDFKRTVNMYTMWKPGMEIQVTHVKRRSIPSFVFPGGVRPSRPSRTTWDSKRSLEAKASERKEGTDGSDDRNKRKRNDDNVDNNLSAKCLAAVSSSSEVHEGSPCVRVHSHSTDCDHGSTDEFGESGREKHTTDIAGNLEVIADIPARDGVSNGPISYTPPEDVLDDLERSSSKEAEKLVIDNVMSGPYGSHKASPQELEELEDDFGCKNESRDSAANEIDGPVDSSPSNKAMTLASCNSAVQSISPFPHGSLDELEPAELLPQSSVAPVVQRKPLIRLNFTSLGKTS
ncbi:Nuclear poly(A) polymerase 1 [Linum grandiflorum]